MKIDFDIETLSNVHVAEDYSLTNYRATATNGGIEGTTFTGSVKVSPHDADDTNIIKADLWGKLVAHDLTHTDAPL